MLPAVSSRAPESPLTPPVQHQVLTGEHRQLFPAQPDCDPSARAPDSAPRPSAQRLGSPASAATAWKCWHRHTPSFLHLDAAAAETQTGHIIVKEKGTWKVLLSEKIDWGQHCGPRFATPEWKQELLTSMKTYEFLPGLGVLIL